MKVVSPEREKARTEATAMMLMEAHALREQFMPFAKLRGIEDVATAYRVQDAYWRRQMARDNTQPGGFKIGLTTKKMQEMCGIDSPVAGYVPANRIYTSGVALDGRRQTHLGLEFEIAVKLDRDFPFRPVAYTQQELSQGVAAVAPGVELVDDRHCDYTTLEALSLIADNSWNEGIVVGAWQEPPKDLGAVEGVVTLDGQELGRGFGRDALGHPYVPLTWLANFRAGTDRPLKKGDVVMTGSLIRTHFPTQTCTYRYTLAGLGSVDVEVRF
ncbi:MAG TPA: fumarylacetoacetate hydrolase family protein [Dongiaceae bacterium]|jgi:2-keto-4-pentenoate hydratase|nr:fumarylacetoacetate hydrolase family protein [Dongiaceae bacterium]